MHSISLAIKSLTIVIPAKAGIQAVTGCPRLTACRGRLIRFGMPGLVYLIFELTMVIVFISFFIFAGAAFADKKAVLTIGFQEETLVFHAEKSPLGECLDEILKEFQVEIVGLEERKDEILTLTLKGNSLQEVLLCFLRTLGATNYAFEFVQNELKRISVFPEGTSETPEPIVEKTGPIKEHDVVQAVEVQGILDNSQAEILEIREGDLIIEYSGMRMQSAYQLWKEVKKSSELDQVEMLVMRNGELMAFDLKGGMIGIRIKTVSVFTEALEEYFNER